MSFVLVLEDGNFMSYEDFFKLTESVEPKETDYGTDFHNKKWNHTPDGHFVYTYFSHKPDQHVLVNLHKESGTLGFGVHKGHKSTDPNDYDEKRTKLGDALKVFNKVAHVTLEGAKEHNLKQIRFNGADEYLDKTYHKIANNKFFQSKMKEHGFHYAGQDSKTKQHIFKKEK